MSPVNTPESTELSDRLVDEAGRILSTDGAAALTLRRLAQAAGVSTMPVYTLFGDKAGLLAAMYRSGYERLGAAMQAAVVEAPEDPLQALADLGHAYRATALENPHLYDLMFGRPVAAVQPGDEDQVAADATYRPLVDAVRTCVEAGALKGDAERIARHLWAVAHGTVSLELAGHLGPEPAQAYEDAMVLSTLPFLS